MAIAFVQAANNINTGTSTTLAITISTSAGALLVEYWREGNSNTNTWTVADSNAVSHAQSAAGYNFVNTTNRFDSHFLANAAAVSSITATFNATIGPLAGVAFEISGAATSSPEDATGVWAIQTSNVTSLTSAAYTTTNADDILLYSVTWSGNTSSPVAGGSYTIPANASNARIAMQYLVVAATQSGVTTSMSWTTARPCGGLFQAYKAAAAAGRTTKNTRNGPLGMEIGMGWQMPI